MDSIQPTSAFQALLQQAPLAALEQELQATQERFRQKLEVYQRTLAELEKLDEELQRQTKLVDVLREIQPSGAHGIGGENDGDDGDSGEAPTMTKREIAERVLRGAPGPLYPREVRDIAVAQGWLPDTPAAGNQLAVAMNRAATKQDYLIKDSEGRYALPRLVGVGTSLFSEDEERGEGP